MKLEETTDKECVPDQTVVRLLWVLFSTRPQLLGFYVLFFLHDPILASILSSWFSDKSDHLARSPCPPGNIWSCWLTFSKDTVRPVSKNDLTLLVIFHLLTLPTLPACGYKIPTLYLELSPVSLSYGTTSFTAMVPITSRDCPAEWSAMSDCFSVAPLWGLTGWTQCGWDGNTEWPPCV